MPFSLQDPRNIKLGGTTQQLLQEVTTASEAVNKLRPLSHELDGKVRDAFMPDRIVASLNMEGIMATRRQTLAVMDAVRIHESIGQGETEIYNALKAHEFVAECCDNGINFSPSLMREINKRLIQSLRSDAGEFRPGPVKLTNAHFTPPEGPAVRPLVDELSTLFPHSESMHPIVQAAWIHEQFTYIHPFNDGNGRTGRLLQDWALVRRGLLPVGIPPALRDDYYHALEMADKQQWDELVEMIADLELKTIAKFQSVVTESAARTSWITKLATAASTKQVNTRHKNYLIWRRRAERVAADFKQAALELDLSSDVIGVTHKEFGIISFQDWEEVCKRGGTERSWLFSLLLFSDGHPFYKSIAYLKRHNVLPGDLFAPQKDLVSIFFTGVDIPEKEKPDFYRYNDPYIRIREIVILDDDIYVYTQEPGSDVWESERVDSLGGVIEQFYSDAFTRKLGL